MKKMIITSVVSFDVCMVLAAKPMKLVSEKMFLKILHESITICLS
jgi:hypothetical protein